METKKVETLKVAVNSRITYRYSDELLKESDILNIYTCLEEVVNNETVTSQKIQGYKVANDNYKNDMNVVIKVKIKNLAYFLYYAAKAFLKVRGLKIKLQEFLHLKHRNKPSMFTNLNYGN